MPEPEPAGVVEHLYIHIPFCPKICPYCSFYKQAGNSALVGPFLDALLTEASQQTQALRPRTIFFGGGTPSSLTTSQLDTLLTGLHRHLDLSSVTECTLEMNPATVTPEKAATLIKHGINRISMGVQSWDDGLLKTLGRAHDSSQAQQSYQTLRDAGFNRINLDLIFGIPGQTRDQWLNSIETTIALAPEHISAYSLTYEEDTEFFLRLNRGEITPDDGLDADLFEITMDRLTTAGYSQYEISNYAVPGESCAHNMAYWTGADYIGLGPSAFSTVGNRRWKNISDTADYIRRIRCGDSAADYEEPIDSNLRTRERLAFALRTSTGIPAILASPWQPDLEKLRDEGYLVLNRDHWQLTRSGRMVADAIAETFI